MTKPTTKARDRSAQRERTRKAILDGARKLLAQGRTVTVAAAAAENNVSKATSYRYFSDPNVLVAEAILDLAVKPYEEIVAGAGDLRAKLKAICVYFLNLALENEAGFRHFLAAAMTERTAGHKVTRRGGRRVKMLRRALSEHENGLSVEQSDMLVQALSAATGLEAMIALMDVAGATREQARETAAFMADAIMDRAFSGVAV